ncbi:hypothetical protein Tco_0096899 [Tanacetum coccineum]
MIVRILGNLVRKVISNFSLDILPPPSAYRVYKRRTRKVMKTMNATFDELLAMAFEQRSKEGLLDISVQDSILLMLYAIRIAPAAPATLNPHTPNASTTIAKIALTPTNSSIEAPTISNTL